MREDERDADLFDAVHSGLIVIDHDRTVSLWNAWMEAASGQRAADVIGCDLDAVVPEHSQHVLCRASRSALEAGASTLLSHVLHPKLLALKTGTGDTMVHDIMVSSIGAAPHRRCLIQVFDVSNAARRERFLRARQNARYDALVESAPDVIVTVDHDGVIRLANPAAEQQFGFTAGELLGCKVDVLFDAPGTWREVLQAREAVPARALEVVGRRKDGSLRYFEVSAAEWRDGARTFTSAFLRDTTERRETERALRESERRSRENARALEELNEVLKQSSEALNALDRRKDEFLATLAHELRNPLAPLRNGLELLKLSTDDPNALTRTCRMMEMQLLQMVRLIDDLLDVSRINNNRVALETERTTLAKIMRHALETSGPIIDAKHHELSIDMPSDEDIHINGDVVRLTQVFSNLLNNAAKYTRPHGQLAVQVEVEQGWVTVRVRDNGIGIPADKLDYVFELFTQVDNSLERAQGGLGIGLSLVKRLVEMHGGTVEAMSEGPGTGSEFVVRLPTATEPEATQDAASDGAAVTERAMRRVLVADDNGESASSLAMLLDLMGHETATANDGLEALKVAETFQPEIALIDIGMPNLNGYDTARRLREAPWGQHMLLVALTGWGQDEDRRRSQDAGFNVHLVKPVDIAEIERLMAGMGAART